MEWFKPHVRRMLGEIAGSITSWGAETVAALRELTSASAHAGVAVSDSITALALEVSKVTASVDRLVGILDPPKPPDDPTTLERWLAGVRAPDGTSTGAYAGLYVAGGQLGVVDEIEADAGRKLAVTAVYYNASSGNVPTPPHLVHAQDGRTIRVAVALNTSTAPLPILPIADVVLGALRVWPYRQWVRDDMRPYWSWLAGKIKAVPRIVLLDFNHEAEGRPVNRTHSFSDPFWLEHSGWGEHQQLHTLDETQAILREYADAVRHVVKILRDEGVENAVIMHTYAALGSNGPEFDPFYRALYPGDDVIDVIAWDPYNALRGEDGWAPPLETFARGYGMIIGGLLDDCPYVDGAGARHKPLLLGEYGCGGSTTEGRRRDWLYQVGDAFIDLEQLVGGIYFSSGGSSTNPAGGPDLHDDPADRAAFAAAMLDPYLAAMPPA